jgi:hypothetical protein
MTAFAHLEARAGSDRNPIMHRFSLPLLALLVVLTLHGVASASPFTPIVDFRTGGVFTPGINTDTHSFSANGVDITIEALRYDGSAYVGDGRVYWDSKDGYGVDGVSYEDDEIEDPEALRISFSQSVIVDRVLITDLFIEGTPSYIEVGSYSIDGGNIWETILADGLYSNGEVELDMQSSLVSSILFTAPGRLANGEDHEFSVAGIDFSTTSSQGDPSNSMPEPSGTLLFALGGLLVGGASRRR